MPLIEPPKNEPDELPEISLEEQGDIPYSEHIRIQRFLNVPNWMCPICGCVVFGRCLKCPICYGKRRTITLRPPTFIEPPL